MQWDQHHYDTIRSSNHDIMKGILTHVGSKGDYYSYGDKGNFRFIDGSSVGQYVIKNFTK